MTAPPTDAAPQRRPGRLLAVLSGLLGVAMLGAMGWGLWVGAGAAWGWFDRPLPDPFEPVERFSADWWLAPVERNAFRRLPVLGTHVNDIAVAGGGETLWAVGERGAIFHSADGGRSWASQAEHIDWSGELPAPAAAGAAGRSGALLISQALAQESSPEAKAPDPQTASNQPSDPPREPIPTPQPQRVPEKSLAPPAVPAPDTRADEPPTPPDEALPEPHPDLNAVQFLADGRRGWAVGDKGTVLATDDAGHSWQPQDSGTQASLYDVQFLADGRRGWAVGGEGSVLATGDGGQSWQPQDSGTTAWLNAVHFLADGRHGWAVGGNGTILATDDGGASWRTQASGTQAGLDDIQVLADGRHGWAVGEDGTVLATDDSGKSWQSQDSGTQAWLTAVQFLTGGQQGWAVGNKGTVLATGDAGQSWQPQVSGTQAPLFAVQFLADSRRGWAVGVDGTVLATNNAGQRWRPQASGMQARLTAVQFLDDGRRGWTVGGGGTVLATDDSGQSWRAQASGMQARLTAVQFLDDGQRGWAVGEDGTVLATDDGGATWRPQDSGTQAGLWDVQFLPDGRRGWAVSPDGPVLATDNGGQSWQPQDSGTQAWLIAVHVLADGRRGWVVGDGGTVLATDDAGQSWQPQDSGTQARLSEVQFLAEGRRGWAVGDDGTVLATGDGGQSWQPQDSGTQARLYDVQFLAEGRRGWAVGDNGTVLASADGGQSWRRQDSGTPAGLWEVHFLVDGRRGWAVGDNGTVLATGDGGQTWTDPVQYAAYPRRVLWVVACALLVAIGWVGLRQPAAGPATAGRTAPAGNAEPDPKLGDVQVKAARSAETANEIPARQSAPPAQPSIAEEGVSDRPVGWDDPDYLGFKPIVRGLSRMLRNARTEPPLTIAFTGPWGSGKSSLMNLLQEELRGWGYRPVWFNVWHHQEEHHMLAALMEAINRQLVPSALTPDGLALRWRMLRQRGKAYWLWILLLLVTLASFTWLAASERPVVLTEASVTDIAGEIWGEETACPAGDASDASDVPPLLGSLCALRHQQFESSRGLIDAVEAGVAGAGGNAFVLTRERRTLIRERAEHLEHPLDSLPATLGSSVTALVTVFSLLSGSRFLGLTPLQLLQSLVGFAGVRRFREETGFRQRFATEFRLVSRALPPHTHLTLILDDLDRCTPDNVVATLETVNLLVSAAPCYVMLGMDRDWVRACVSLRYEEIARELAAQEHRPAGDGEAETYTFAQRYLEKLINLEVPVPRPSSEQTRRLLGWQRRDRRPQLQWRRRRLLLRRLRRKRDRPALTRRVIIWAGAARALAATRWAAWLLRPRAALAAGVVLIAAAGWQQGWPPPFAAPSNDGARMTTRAAPLADPGAKPGTQPAPASGPERPTDERPAVDLRAGGAGEFRPGGQPDTSAWWWLPGGLALVLAALVAGQRRWREIADRLPAIRRVERDTPEFARALDIWHPVVVALPHNNTPRAVKRFKNRVRYFAVRQRDLPAPRNLLERFLEPARRWMRPRYGAFADAEPIPEPLLVALGAIHHCDPRCLDTQESFEAVLARQPAAAAGDGDTRSAETATIPGAHEAMRRAVQESIEAQQEHFPGTWPPADAQRRQFLAMTARLRAD